MYKHSTNLERWQFQLLRTGKVTFTMLLILFIKVPHIRGKIICSLCQDLPI